MIFSRALPAAAVALGFALPASALPLGEAFLDAEGSLFVEEEVFSDLFDPAGRDYEALLIAEIVFSAGFDLPLDTPALYTYSLSASVDGATVVDEGGPLGLFAVSDLLPASDIEDLLSLIGGVVAGGPYGGSVAGDTYDAMFSARFAPLSPTSFTGSFFGAIGVHSADRFPSELAMEIDGFGLPGEMISGFLSDFYATQLSPYTPIDSRFALNASLTAESVTPSVTSEVPVPAAAPLLLAGVAGLGWMARRRRAPRG